MAIHRSILDHWDHCTGCTTADFLVGGAEKTKSDQAKYIRMWYRDGGDSWVQFKAQYYIFALVFLVFDVETVFLFPWALAINKLPLYTVLEGILFILILVAGLVYAWRKGMLEWM